MLATLATSLIYFFLFLTLFFQVFLIISFLDRRKDLDIFADNRKILDVWMSSEMLPTVAIIIPAWNEEKTILKTLTSVVALKYPTNLLEILVVDNASTDGTLLLARSFAEKHSHIRIFQESEQGKHCAVNKGLRETKASIIGCLDADSEVDSYALLESIYKMRDEVVMGVTPSLMIKTPQDTWIQMMQYVEYLNGVFMKVCFGAIDGIQVMPGPFSLIRSSVFEKLGPYKHAYNTEDFELTLRMQEARMKIVNSPHTYVYTVGPSTVRGLIRQRTRWIRGFILNIRDYRHMLFNKNYGSIGIFTLPATIIFIYYICYASLYSFWKLAVLASGIVHRWMTVGFSLQFPRFDLYFLHSEAVVFIGLATFTLFLIVLFAGRAVAEEGHSMYKHFILFFFFYPYLIPLFVYGAIVKAHFVNGGNRWHLQDNKA